MSPLDPRFLTVEQTAVRLQCERTTVFELLKTGKLKRAPKYGRRTTITLASIEALENPRGGSFLTPPKNPAIPQQLDGGGDWNEFRRSRKTRVHL